MSDNECRRLRMTRAVCACAVALLACNAYQDEVVDLAYIHFSDSDSVFFSAPDTVQAGTPFEVTIRSYGGGCTQQGDTRVTANDFEALVEPFDVTSRVEVCTKILKVFTHRASVTFAKAGTTTVRVRGRALIEAGRDSIVTRARSVVVR